MNLPRSASGYAKRFMCASNLSAVSASVMMVKRSVFNEVDGFDERFKVSCHDVDFCLKVNKAGYRVVYNGDIEFYHQENATSVTRLPMNSFYVPNGNVLFCIIDGLTTLSRATLILVRASMASHLISV